MRHDRLYRLLAGALLLSAVLTASAGQSSSTRFGIGDLPPALEPMLWISGEPVAAFEPGRIYVVNFFATWCGASRQAMMQMARLAGEHGDGLTIVGVNVREAERGTPTVEAVSRFVAERPESFGYAVAMDDPDSAAMFERWMRGSEMYGTPTAFIVGRDGRVAWIGIPIDDRVVYPFEQALADAMREGSDLALSRKVHADTASQIATYLRDREVLAEVNDAVARGDHAATLAAVETVVAARPEYRQRMLFVVLTALMHEDQARALALAEQELAALQVELSADQVDRIAGGMGRTIAAHPDASEHALASALAYLQRGLRTDPESFSGFLNLLAVARLEHARGRPAQAVEAQERALEVAHSLPDLSPDVLARLEQELATYRAALAR